ncbi:metalloregulator ArsR/SmtB family transcription factor [Mycobacteroides abscessus subsp. abscessus]|uniref:Bacterial regulatory, arsR family protein n=6 Tax=Mycobacteroides abscessus TaxID=36809 RepID=A0A829PV69_9MYCO|nr:metalloregulator ArsR/SmtB family transcription factor [Mycobacteroides abscessus]ESV57005.1 bacterial regulatory, arsR family protein [Mycobacteroides abscessus MAB_082312_2258]ESV65394.1 bacterial regulatory, arsR family protein [Mycobacteroides abscessus MAB_091912_2446]ETZ91250.1 bacterial regulatory, arsR family protein [Mycobacteroides abscessus MAB_030201_1075]ETZ93973.1 bacterial regulatory, arsR family protein [Mycobacteroides abscessus MAB_030201_1061]AIC71336.1 ArsR family transc
MDAFMVIADPTRRRIIDALRGGPADVTTLIERLDISQSLVSKHLGVLRDAGTVRVEVAGKRRVYHLADDPLPAVLAWVTPYHRKWASALDRLTFLIDSDAGMHDTEKEVNRD